MGDLRLSGRNLEIKRHHIPLRREIRRKGIIVILLYIKYSFILEIHIESGTERREISIVVFDVLERWLKGNGFRQLSFPRYFQRIFRTLLEAGVLARQSALVLLVLIGTAQFCVSVAAINPPPLK